MSPIRTRTQTSVVLTRLTHQALWKQTPAVQLCIWPTATLSPPEDWELLPDRGCPILPSVPQCTGRQKCSLHACRKNPHRHTLECFCAHKRTHEYRWNPHEAASLNFSPHNYWVILFKMCFFFHRSLHIFKLPLLFPEASIYLMQI